MTAAAVEEQAVWQWRFDQLCAHGYAAAEAVELANAGGVDLELARRLVLRGCEPRLAVRILL